MDKSSQERPSSKSSGQKAAETKGPEERKRAALMAGWSRRYGKGDPMNPYTKKNYYQTLQSPLEPSIDEQLDWDAQQAQEDGDFDANNVKTIREKILREINLRRGQPSFRKALLQAYGNRCAISGCDGADALEAAHIHPYGGADTNHVQNGILLRSDLHTLFDIGKLGIEPGTYRVVVAKSLMNTVYGKLHGTIARIPELRNQVPSSSELRLHLDRWKLESQDWTLNSKDRRI